MKLYDLLDFVFSISDSDPNSPGNSDIFDYNAKTDTYDPRHPGNIDLIDNFEDNMSEENNNEGDQGARDGAEEKGATTKGEEEGGIGVWTLYIIVGAVAGGVLLAGLVAIAIALCCQREDDSQYKSTSV